MLTHATTRTNLEELPKENKLVTKGQILYDSTYMNSQSYIEKIRMWWSGCGDRREGEVHDVYRFLVFVI